MERADQLLRTREPEIAVPPRRERTEPINRRWIVRIAVLTVVAVGVGLLAGNALRQVRLVPAGSREIGVTLAGVAIGASPAEVRSAVGEPLQVTNAGRTWFYPNGPEIFFEGPPDLPQRVERIFASGRYAVQGTVEAPRLYFPEDFRKAYADRGFAVSEWADVQTVLAVTGRGPDGSEVTVMAYFFYEGSLLVTQPTVVPKPNRLAAVTIFRGRPVGAPPDPCRLIAVAVNSTGVTWENLLNRDPNGELFGWPNGLGPSGDLACSGGPFEDSAHLALRLAPTSAADASALLARSLPAGGSWTLQREGVWLARGVVDTPHGKASFSVVAVSADPYFFVVTASESPENWSADIPRGHTDEDAGRLADAVLRQLPGRP